jgi:hypothetical protein
MWWASHAAVDAKTLPEKFDTYLFAQYADRAHIILNFCTNLLFPEGPGLPPCCSLYPVCKESFRKKRSLKTIRNIPGYRVLLSPTSALGYILPRIPGVCAGNNHFFEEKHARKLTSTMNGQYSCIHCCSL